MHCHFLLQGIFPSQGSNPHLLCLLPWQVGSLPLAPPGKFSFFLYVWKVWATQSCLTLGDPMDHSLPGYSVHGFFQARILVWVAISFSQEYSQSQDWTCVPRIAGRFFTIWTTRKTLFFMCYSPQLLKTLFCLSRLDSGWSLVLESILTNLYFRWLSSLAIVKSTGKKLSGYIFCIHVCSSFP